MPLLQSSLFYGSLSSVRELDSDLLLYCLSVKYIRNSLLNHIEERIGFSSFEIIYLIFLNLCIFICTF